MEVRQITTTHVQRWVMAEYRSGASARTIEAKYKVLSICLGARRGMSAVRDGLIQRNPCDGVELPSWVAKEKVVYDVVEVDKLMAQIDDWWQPLVMLAADTGLRLGELAGLRVSDLVDGVVSVNRTIIELKKSETTTGTRFQEKPWPKGKRRRKVRMSPEVEVYMRRVIESRRLAPQDRLFSMPGRDGEVDRTPEWPFGRPLSRAYIRQSVWLPAHEVAGVPRVVGESKRSFHHLRGSHISWLLAGGADVTSVMERAGHRQLSTTQLYVDAMPDAEARALEALARYLNRRRGIEPPPST